MIRGLYAAATGIDAATLSQNMTAENLANANVPGYRRRGVSFSTFEQVLDVVAPPQPPPQAVPVVGQPQQPGALPQTTTQSLLGTQPALPYTVFEPGPLEQTNNPLDVAASGNAFFVVQGPNGQLLTKNGGFLLNRANQLVTSGGLQVLGRGGAITIPPDAADIHITEDGVIQADGNEVDRLQIAVVPLPQVLQRAGSTLFFGNQQRGEPEPGTVRVLQGYREGSNVQGVRDMVDMLGNLRYLEAADRSLRTLSEAIGQQTRPT